MFERHCHASFPFDPQFCDSGDVLSEIKNIVFVGEFCHRDSLEGVYIPYGPHLTRYNRLRWRHCKFHIAPPGVVIAWFRPFSHGKSSVCVFCRVDVIEHDF